MRQNLLPILALFGVLALSGPTLAPISDSARTAAPSDVRSECGITSDSTLCTAPQPHFSTAGFYELPGTGRRVYSMNPAWRLYPGPLEGAEAIDFDDRSWELVSLPDGIEYLPSEASGCVNYQGEVWYRKHFTPRGEWRGKRILLHFEAIMGKSEVWINGRWLTRHYGGYLPVVVDLTEHLRYGGDNVIAVRADNSDDPTYPPGKPQDALDFAYFGGIYRDCWLVVHNPVYITDPHLEDLPAGGGLFVSCDEVSEASARVRMETHLRNRSGRSFRGRVVCELYDRAGQLAASAERTVRIPDGEAVRAVCSVQLIAPQLWSPDSPSLYNLHVYVKDPRGGVVDGYRRRIGIRSIEFRGRDGFWLNGKPYPWPLIGANRHQDFAVVGNALSNSLHWRDACKLRSAGLRVIRNAHYPQDPAFMDACDELGLFVIVNTPGWQFWNRDSLFAERVYSDIRQMVRRDRNHPSVWLWEPILNETWYPADFAERALAILREEYPYSSCYAACDATARGAELFQVQFTHPLNGGGGAFNTETLDPAESYFTREWGDNVDDWNSHNSPSRANRAWGEGPMRVQAEGYARTDYRYTCYDALWRTSRQHVGGCLWHAFDHQRGYHPDPFYGGLLDAFRQPKYSYYLFCAQRPPQVNDRLMAHSGPVVWIAHAMTPFSGPDAEVYSNCDEVRLTLGAEGEQRLYRKAADTAGMPSPIIRFEGVFDVMRDRALSRAGRQAESYLLAEGIVDGRVVATHRVAPARRPSQLLLKVDDEQLRMRADGSDLVTVVAAVADANGTVKRLNNAEILFEIEGPGELVASAETFTNPRRISWGTAPILVRATTRPGTIRIRARVVRAGKHTPLSAELEIPTFAPEHELIVDPSEEAALLEQRGVRQSARTPAERDIEREIERLRQELNVLKLHEVERQQQAFE